MHPAVFGLIVVGGALVLWGGYEAINTLYEWHNDRKEQREYEEYVRMHNEKGIYVPVTTLFENEDEDDGEPLAFWKQKNSGELRQRNTHRENDELPPKYELSDMEKSISNRRDLLMKQSELLEKEEAELERQRSLVRAKGNSIMGVFDDQEEEKNPFSDDKFITHPFDDQQRSNCTPIIESSTSTTTSPVITTEQQNSSGEYSFVIANHDNSDEYPVLVNDHNEKDNKSDASWSDIDEHEFK